MQEAGSGTVIAVGAENDTNTNGIRTFYVDYADDVAVAQTIVSRLARG